MRRHHREIGRPSARRARPSRRRRWRAPAPPPDRAAGRVARVWAWRISAQVGRAPGIVLAGRLRRPPDRPPTSGATSSPCESPASTASWSPRAAAPPGGIIAAASQPSTARRLADGGDAGEAGAQAVIRGAGRHGSARPAAGGRQFLRHPADEGDQQHQGEAVPGHRIFQMVVRRLRQMLRRRGIDVRLRRPHRHQHERRHVRQPERAPIAAGSMREEAPPRRIVGRR